MVKDSRIRIHFAQSQVNITTIIMNTCKFMNNIHTKNQLSVLMIYNSIFRCPRYFPQAIKYYFDAVLRKTIKNSPCGFIRKRPKKENIHNTIMSAPRATEILFSLIELKYLIPFVPQKNHKNRNRNVAIANSRRKPKPST